MKAQKNTNVNSSSDESTHKNTPQNKYHAVCWRGGGPEKTAGGRGKKKQESILDKMSSDLHGKR